MSSRPIRALASVLCAASLLGSGSASAAAPSDTDPPAESQPVEPSGDTDAPIDLGDAEIEEPPDSEIDEPSAAPAEPEPEPEPETEREAQAEPEPSKAPESEGPRPEPLAAPVDGPPEKPGSTLIKVGVGVTSVGVLAGAAALAMLGLRKRAESEVAAESGFAKGGSFQNFEKLEATEQRRLDAMDRARTYDTVGLVLAGVTAFYVTTGVIILSRGVATRRSARRMSIAPAVSPRQVGLGLQGRF